MDIPSIPFMPLGQKHTTGILRELTLPSTGTLCVKDKTDLCPTKSNTNFFCFFCFFNISLCSLFAHNDVHIEINISYPYHIKLDNVYLFELDSAVSR